MKRRSPARSSSAEEESRYLPVTFVRDKDAVAHSAISSAKWQTGWLVQEPLAAREFLDDLHQTLALLSKTSPPSRSRAGRHGQIAKIMNSFRHNPPKEFSGRGRACRRHQEPRAHRCGRQSSPIRWPSHKEDVIQFFLAEQREDHDASVGTEARYKFYFSVLRQGHERDSRFRGRNYPKKIIKK